MSRVRVSLGDAARRWRVVAAGALVIALLASAWWLLTLGTRGSEIATVLGLPLTALSLLAAIGSGMVAIRAPHPRNERRDDAMPPQPPTAPELVIAKNGQFVGSDKVAIDVVFKALEVPAADRLVRIRAEALDDESYKYRDPDGFAKLERNIQSYELSIGRLLRGSVHYYLQWQRSHLAEAVLELRCIELPAQADREWWAVWPVADPSKVIRVGLDDVNVRWLRTGAYRFERTAGQFGIIGMPTDEPIWLTEIDPAIVWTRVVPAVVAQRTAEHPGPEDPPVLDITDWVLSDREPSELVRTRPSEGRHDRKPQTWTW